VKKANEDEMDFAMNRRQKFRCTLLIMIAIWISKLQRLYDSEDLMLPLRAMIGQCFDINIRVACEAICSYGIN
jgi:hypothetical protein